MTAEFIIIYYILYWIRYAVLIYDRHSTDGQFFHSPGTGVEARRSGMNKYVHLFTTIHHCAVLILTGIFGSTVVTTVIITVVTTVILTVIITVIGIFWFIRAVIRSF